MVLGGYADAIAMDGNGNIDMVIDWKSDVEVTPADKANYRSQMSDYLSALGAARGAIVYMTRGVVDEVAAKK